MKSYQNILSTHDFTMTHISEQGLQNYLQLKKSKKEPGIHNVENLELGCLIFSNKSIKLIK